LQIAPIQELRVELMQCADEVSDAQATNQGHSWLDLQEANERYATFELLQCSKQRSAPGASLPKLSQKIGSRISNFRFRGSFHIFCRSVARPSDSKVQELKRAMT
jgi:hypothetical protein